MSAQNLPPLDPNKGRWDERVIGRRSILELGFWVVAGAAGLTLGGAGTRFLVGHSLEAKAQRWVALGKIADLLPGKMHRLVYSYEIADAWRRVNQSGVLYAFSADGETYLVLDGTCTHLGCNVHWKEEKGHFACPCHEGFYTQEGHVISGPPPRPLRRLQVRIEDGTLLALV